MFGPSPLHIDLPMSLYISLKYHAFQSFVFNPGSCITSHAMASPFQRDGDPFQAMARTLPTKQNRQLRWFVSVAVFFKFFNKCQQESTHSNTFNIIIIYYHHSIKVCPGLPRNSIPNPFQSQLLWIRSMTSPQFFSGVVSFFGKARF